MEVEAHRHVEGEGLAAAEHRPLRHLGEAHIAAEQHVRGRVEAAAEGESILEDVAERDGQREADRGAADGLER